MTSIITSPVSELRIAFCTTSEPENRYMETREFNIDVTYTKNPGEAIALKKIPMNSKAPRQEPVINLMTPDTLFFIYRGGAIIHIKMETIAEKKTISQINTANEIPRISAVCIASNTFPKIVSRTAIHEIR